MDEATLQKDLTAALSRAGADAAAGIPDHALAAYLVGCLKGLLDANRAGEKHRGEHWVDRMRATGLDPARLAPTLSAEIATLEGRNAAGKATPDEQARLGHLRRHLDEIGR